MTEPGRHAQNGKTATFWRALKMDRKTGGEPRNALGRGAPG